MVADRALPRMRGLLGHPALPQSRGLLLTPAPSVHTALMRFAIDVVFLDHKLVVTRVVPDLRPWRTASSRRARSALELPAGTCEACGVRAGDKFALLDPADEAITERATPRRLDRSGGEHSQAVLIIAADRRFRAVARTLLGSRGWDVDLLERDGEIGEALRRSGAEVALVDVSESMSHATDIAASVLATAPGTKIVFVSSAIDESLGSLPILPKWGSLDDLCAAIEGVQEPVL
jgi:uncharacterized protein